MKHSRFMTSVASNARNALGWLQKSPHTLLHLPVTSGVMPRFLGIGAQKAGTSWLYENLRRHPEVFIPDDRYLHYFDRNYHKSFEWYARHFSDGAGKVCGEVIPGYGLIGVDRIRAIKTVMPEVRLIFIMRDPIDRAWSHARMRLLRVEGRDPDDLTPRDFIEHFKRPISQTKGSYVEIIDRWLSVFPKQTLLLCFNEDIADRPHALLNRVFDHIGVSRIDDFTGFDSGRVNEGVSVDMPDECAVVLKEMYAEEIAVLSTRYGGAADAWRKRYYPG